MRELQCIPIHYHLSHSYLTIYKQSEASFTDRNQVNDHIIRDGNDYARIVEYIQDNPLNWADDEYNV